MKMATKISVRNLGLIRTLGVIFVSHTQPFTQITQNYFTAASE